MDKLTKSQNHGEREQLANVGPASQTLELGCFSVSECCDYVILTDLIDTRVQLVSGWNGLGGGHVLHGEGSAGGGGMKRMYEEGMTQQTRDVHPMLN